MRNIYLRIFQVLILALVVALAVSTLVVPGAEVRIEPGNSGVPIVKMFGLDHFYNSTLNVVLWVALCLAMLMSIFLKGLRSLAQKSLHFLLVMIILLVFYDKAVNQRFTIPIREGQEVNFANYIKNPDPVYQIPLRLLKFEIQMHPGSPVPAAFNSWLLISRTDTTKLAVNKPVPVGRYMLYQNAYKQDHMLEVISGGDTSITPFNSKIILNRQEIFLHDYNDSTQTLHMEIGGAQYQVPMGVASIVGGQKMQILPLGPKYTSIIEVADVTGVNILALFALMYLVALAYNFWWKQPK